MTSRICLVCLFSSCDPFFEGFIENRIMVYHSAVSKVNRKNSLCILNSEKENDNPGIPLVLVPQVLDDVIKLLAISRMGDFLRGGNADISCPGLLVESINSRFACQRKIGIKSIYSCKCHKIDILGFSEDFPTGINFHKHL